MAGVHLTVSLCAYDALLTFVLLSQCAIFAEISVDHEERLRLVKYSQVQSNGIFFINLLSILTFYLHTSLRTEMVAKEVLLLLESTHSTTSTST